jgi:hypothetical protein
MTGSSYYILVIFFKSGVQQTLDKCKMHEAFWNSNQLCNLLYFFSFSFFFSFFCFLFETESHCVVLDGLKLSLLDLPASDP